MPPLRYDKSIGGREKTETAQVQAGQSGGRRAQEAQLNPLTAALLLSVSVSVPKPIAVLLLLLVAVLTMISFRHLFVLPRLDDELGEEG